MIQTADTTCKLAVASAHQAALAAGAECLDAALNYLRCGWSALCICPPDHCGVGRGHAKSCSSPGKTPWGAWREFQDRLPTEDELRAKWRDLPVANVGVVLGPVSGLVRIDVDGAGGEQRLAELSRGDLPATLEFVSGRPNGGRGLLYGIPEGAVLRTTSDCTGERSELRIQARGAQTVLPPSRHPSGTRYRWADGRGPADIDPAPAPAWLLDALRPEAHPANGRPSTAAGERIPAGARNTTLTSLAGSMRRRGMGREAILAALAAENAARCDPPLGAAEVESIAASVSRYSPHTDIPPSLSNNGDGDGHEPDHSDPSTIHLTDLGNAQRLVHLHGSDLRYCFPWGKWLVWDGIRWAIDDTGAVVRLTKGAVRALYTEASSAKTEAERAALAKWAINSEKVDRLNAMVALARSESGIPVLPDALDSNPWLLNVVNGTVDLRTGQLRPHRREDMLTKLAPVEYIPDACCQLWLRCLNRWMDGKQNLIGYLQRVAGYCLTGDVSEQCLWFFHGGGCNGKSKYLGAILDMLGDYGCQAVSDLLLAKANETHPTERADLFGRRCVSTIETEEGKRMAESLMKQLTGGDKVRARRMRQDFFEFTPTHKVILAANHRPSVRGQDLAVWRRIKLVPFTVTITDQERDPALGDKLKAELSGILAWAVQGCLAWQRDGIDEPDEVRQAAAAYQFEQDTLAGFLGEACLLHAEARCKSSILLGAYHEWSADRSMTPCAFAKKLQSKGYVTRKRDGANWWIGIGLQGG